MDRTSYYVWWVLFGTRWFFRSVGNSIIPLTTNRIHVAPARRWNWRSRRGSCLWESMAEKSKISMASMENHPVSHRGCHANQLHSSHIAALIKTLQIWASLANARWWKPATSPTQPSWPREGHPVGTSNNYFKRSSRDFQQDINIPARTA